MPAPSLNTAALLALHNVAVPGEIISLDGADNRPRIPRTVLQKMDYIFAHADLRAALTAELDDILNNLESRVSPSSKKKRLAADAKWVNMIHNYEPDLPLDKVWDEEIVKKYYLCMLPILASQTEGTKGRHHLKASTLKGFKELLIWSIAKHTTDADGKRCGPILLSKGGFLSTLDDQVYTLINKHGLDRTEDPKLYYSEPELKLVIQEYLKMSENSNRLATLQKMCIVLTLFFTSLRPGSLGPSNNQYAAQGKFPTLRNLKIFRLGFMTFKVEFTCEHFKGNNNTAQALVRKYVFQPVVQWYNVHLDLALYFVTFLLARGALEGLSTIQDLRKSNLLEIKIKESMKTEPLFLAFQDGGKQFVADRQPLTARGITSLIKIVTRNAGLAEGTAYCFRRGAANDYEVILGKEFSEQLLTHTPGGSLHFYSENTANVNIVGARLNELPIPMDTNKEAILNSKIPTSRGVQAVIYLLQIKKLNEQKLNDHDEGEDYETGNAELEDRNSVQARCPRNERSATIKLTKEEKIAIELASPQFRITYEQVESKWKAFMACYPPALSFRKQEYKMTLANINTIRQRSDSKGLVPKEAINKAESEVRAAMKSLNTLRTRLYRQARVVREKKDCRDRETSFNGTVDEVNNAIQDLLSKPSFLVKPPTVVQPPSFADDPSRMLAGQSQDLSTRSVVETAQTTTRPVEASSTVIAVRRPSDPFYAMPVPGPSTNTSIGFRNGTSATAGVPPSIAPVIPSSTRNSMASNNKADDSTSQGVVHNIQSNQGDDSEALYDDDSDEEDDPALLKFSQNLLNSIPKHLKASTVSKSNDLRNGSTITEPEELTPCSITDIESHEVVQNPVVETADVRSAYIETLIAPIITESAFQSLNPMPDGKFKCPRCEQFFVHRPDLQAATFYSRAKVRRHVITQHTTWKELVLLMIDKGSELYHCPLAPKCSFVGDNEDEVRDHCLKECIGKERFNLIVKEHDSLVDDNRTVRKKIVSHSEFTYHHRKVFGPQKQKRDYLVAYIHTLADLYPLAYKATVERIYTIATHSWSSVEPCTMEQFEREARMWLLSNVVEDY